MAKPMKAFRPKNAKATIKRLMGYVKYYPWHSLGMLISTILSVGANVGGTYVIKLLIESILNIASGVQDFSTLIPQFVGLVAIYLTGVIGAFMTQRLAINFSTGIMRTVRDQMFEHMSKLPIRYFDTHTHGEVMSSYTNDTEALREMLSVGVPNLVNSSLSIIGVFILMLILSPIMTLIALPIMGIMYLIIKVLSGKSKKAFSVQQAALSKVNGYIEEYIEGQKVVKVFCHEQKTKEGFAKNVAVLRHEATKGTTYANIIMPLLGNVAYLFYTVSAIVGGLLVIGGAFVSVNAGIAVVTAFLQSVRQFTQPVGQIAQQMNGVIMGIAGVERIFMLLDEKVDEDNGYVTLVNANIDESGNITESDVRTDKWAWKHPHTNGTLTYTELKGEVEFEEVTFGYNPDKVVLKDVSLYAKRGQKIAFVGSTGAGKTTITNLINRFYDVPDGKIRYDGININKIKKSDLRRSMAMVLQDTHLFTGTVMENIRYGRLDATDAEVIESAKLANAHGFIKHLENGYDTVLTADGSNLSQGQRQLLAIARAMIAEPPVLILDEATSSIDTRTEKLIEAGLDSLMKGRTVFVIAHRLSTVRNSDVIMVMEHGRVIEHGSHDSLIAQGGKYYQLYTGLFQLD